MRASTNSGAAQSGRREEFIFIGERPLKIEESKNWTRNFSDLICKTFKVSMPDDSDLKAAQFNRAFVLIEYFGYLRRDPNAAPDVDFSGYTFWLNKLNSFN
jgi:hypothetical protein